MEKITMLVADFYGVYYKTLFLPCKSSQKQSIAKQMAMLLITEYVPLVTYASIGKFFNRDHSTIVHGKKAIKNEMEVNKQRLKEYHDFKAQLDLIEFSIEQSPFCKSTPFKIK